MGIVTLCQKKRTKSNFHFCQKIVDFDDALNENHPYLKGDLLHFSPQKFAGISFLRSGVMVFFS